MKDKQTQRLWKQLRIGALMAALALLTFPAVTAKADSPSVAGDHRHNFLRGWTVLDRTKDGAVAVQYQVPDPFSNIWQWQFRSTYKKPVHVDYTVVGFSVRGNGAVHRTAYIPAHGTTELLGFPSRLEPQITIDQVRE